MNTKMKMTVARLLSGAMVLLGFASCDDDKVMYGSPSVKFQVKGKVTSDIGTPLEGIQVIVRANWDNNSQGRADTIYTDAKGEFASQEIEAGGLNAQTAYFNDVDGAANGGTFKSDSISLKTMDKKQLEKGNEWYAGKFELTTTVKLKEKTDN